MTFTEYIKWVIENWLPYDPNDPNTFITEIYIFDHASSSSIQIGDTSLRSGSPALGVFTYNLREALKKGYASSAPVIHFRGCKIAEEDVNGKRPFLQELASLTGLRVTACEKEVMLLPIWKIVERPGPDYDFVGRVYMSDPQGNITQYSHSMFDILDYLNERKY